MSKDDIEDIEIVPEIATAASGEFKRLIERLKKEAEEAKVKEQDVSTDVQAL